MDAARHRRVTEGDWLAASLSGPHAVAFKRHLTERGYAAHAVASYVAEVTHFARWVCTRRRPLARIDEIPVAIFLDDRQVHRAFGELRQQLRWPDRGSHHAARIHDPRHTFVIRRNVQRHAQGVGIDQAMLSLSTYIGHAMVTEARCRCSWASPATSWAMRRRRCSLPTCGPS